MANQRGAADRLGQHHSIPERTILARLFYGPAAGADRRASESPTFSCQAGLAVFFGRSGGSELFVTAEGKGKIEIFDLGVSTTH
jgi:hypothetical protein